MPNNPTPEERAALRVLCEKATRGAWQYIEVENPPNDLGREKMPNAVPLMSPWIVTDWIHPQLKAQHPIVGLSSGPYNEEKHTLWMRAEDGRFIAAARTALPRLIDALEASEAKVKVLQEGLHWIENTTTEKFTAKRTRDIRKEAGCEETE